MSFRRRRRRRRCFQRHRRLVDHKKIKKIFNFLKIFGTKIKERFDTLILHVGVGRFSIIEWNVRQSRDVATALPRTRCAKATQASYCSNDENTKILRCEKSFCKIFREVFRSFCEVFRSFCEVFQSFRKFFEVFASFWRLSDPFGPIGMHSDAFGSNWKRLDVAEFF